MSYDNASTSPSSEVESLADSPPPSDDAIKGDANSQTEGDNSCASTHTEPPQTETTIVLRNHSPIPAVPIGHGRIDVHQADHAPLPKGTILGRYRIERMLGAGGFGIVYLAYDIELNRWVALKVPHARRLGSQDAFKRFFDEARLLAQLDHEGIVPIYDVGRVGETGCFLVTKLIDGTNLNRRLWAGRPAPEVVAVWLATAAEALHYAHSQGFIHRDVKPANLLIDSADRLYVSDFGLAGPESDFVACHHFAGTPAYTSPEQARCEGHRVDVRSDVFSLGVVCYELLTGTNPYKARDNQATLRKIIELIPRPPRDLDPEIPEELEHICLKAIAKCSDDRYESAAAMALDFRQWLVQQSALGSGERAVPVRRPWILPRGLRPYEADDADFFLELLPGTRGRNRLPECLQFWKDRIEAVAVANGEPFRVGVLYGPTGSGKSSLVRAGLLPRLEDRVLCISIEASAEETEPRLLRGLYSKFPELTGEPDLASVLRALRNGRGLEPNQKVLIVLDQFEQWLFGRSNVERRALEDGLRQCDGVRIQALLLVRDEFWMALTRFARALEIRLVQGNNMAAADRFDLEHSRRVLYALGRAYGRLSEDINAMSSEHRQFLDQALEGLAQDGRVVCVRLALFAELLKQRPWVPATLEELGGAQYVGVAFLEEAFFSAKAPPQNQLHQQAACEVLRRLLPADRVAIKGHRCSRNDLLEVSGYADDPEAFAELIQILDHQLLLVTPVEPADGNPPTASEAIESVPKFYQLTHDYLIPDLREWLYRHQQGTIRGRAELRLQEFAAVWAGARNAQVLPTVGEWLVIRLLTRSKRWTATERQLMHTCAVRHARRLLVAGMLLLGLLGFASWQLLEMKAHAWVEKLQAADVDQVVQIAKEDGPSRHRALPLLRQGFEQAIPHSREQLNFSIALLENDQGQIAYLIDRLLVDDLETSLAIRDALAPYREAVVDPLWEVALNPACTESARLRAALALSRLATAKGWEATGPDADRWAQIAEPTAEILVSTLDTNPVYFSELVKAIEPVAHVLSEPLEAIYRSNQDGRRSMATNILASIAAEEPEILQRLILDADIDQFQRLSPLLDRHRARILDAIGAELAETDFQAVSVSADSDETQACRKAVAVLCMLRMGDPRIPWRVFQQAPDPRCRTFLIHNAAKYGISIEILMDRLSIEEDPSILRGLLFTIGQYPPEQRSQTVREEVVALVQNRFLAHQDAGLHAAAEWFLKNWNLPNQDAMILEKLQAAMQMESSRNWYLTHDGQLMVIIDAREVPDIRRIYAISAKEIMLEQMKRHHPGYRYNPNVMVDKTSPAGTSTWLQAVEFCESYNQSEKIDSSNSCYFGPGARKEGELIRADLEQTGYRLPTQAEWEYACRAGTVTSRYYGNRDDLLTHYAWYFENSEGKLWPVGRRMPNDFGLFDLYGNVLEWTTDLSESGERILIAGGGMGHQAERLTSSTFAPAEHSVKFDSYGFRIARTIEFED